MPCSCRVSWEALEKSLEKVKVRLYILVIKKNNYFFLISGLSQFSGSSANFGVNHDQMEQMDLDFKDQTGYGTEPDPYTYPNSDTIGTINANQLYGGDQDVAMSRYSNK